MYSLSRLYPIVWLAVAALVVLSPACSPASKPATEPAPKQEPAGGLLQDAPPTQELEVVDVNSDQMPPLDPTKWTAKDCPNLQSQLQQVIQSSNPVETAKLLGLRVQEDRVLVLVVLKDEDARFLEDFDIEPGKLSGTQVQAFVPFSRLCELANTDNVIAIRLPDQAVGP